LLADRFIEHGLVEVEMEFGALQITDTGREVLAGEQVLVAFEESKAIAVKEEHAEYDPILFEDLRILRRRTAEEESVPPYVVFSDRTLMEMAAAFPTTPESLLRIHGVGERKSEVYGERFRAAIQGYVERNGTETPRQSMERSGSRYDPSRRFHQVGEAFNAGESIEQIQTRWGVTRSTILNHLLQYLRAGNYLDADRLLQESTLSLTDQTRIFALFDQLGHQRLGPAFEALEGSIPYEDLHLLRLVLLSRTTPDPDTTPRNP
jgi:ATP-dependent DNA helicase RecQ